MKQLRVIPFSVAVALALSGCGLFGGSDGTDVAIAESQPTPNVVQQIPVDPTVGPEGTPAAGGVPLPTGIALPTAMALPTTAPTAEPTPDRSQPTTYIVQSGDVLGLIAEEFDVPIADLREANDLDGNLIRVGQELIIPAAGSSSESAGAAPAPTRAASSGSGSGSSGSGSGGSGGGSSAPVSCAGSGSGHCIQPGESLTGIALKYGVTVDELRAANPGISGDLIRSGQVLNLPGGSSSASDGDPVPPGDPVAPGTGAPTSNAECAAKNPAFPFFHASDGLCYANPIGGPTAVPTAVGGSLNQTCPPGRFLFTDGLCYPIPGATVTAVPNATPRPNTTPFVEDYGVPPCDPWEEVLTTGKCWPSANATQEQIERGRVGGAGSSSTPTPTPTARP